MKESNIRSSDLSHSVVKGIPQEAQNPKVDLYVVCDGHTQRKSPLSFH